MNQRRQFADPVAVERRIEGDRSIVLNLPERELAVRLLTAKGLSDPTIGDRIGIDGRSVFRIRKRLGIESQWRQHEDVAC